MRTGFFQLVHFRYWMRQTIGAIFTDRSVTAHTGTDDQAISQFQSLCTALAATIGTGNIVGVATAILSGGPGAVFWMWVMALLGMMTSFSENVLGIFYRHKNEEGAWQGGAMYYLADGLGRKKGCKQLGRVLAVLFAASCVLASFGMGNMSQINSIAGNLRAAFGVPELATGVVLAGCSAAVIFGGLKRVAAVAERVVPLMALFYLGGALVVVLVHASAVPAAFAAIFRGAFGLAPAGGAGGGFSPSHNSNRWISCPWAKSCSARRQASCALALAGFSTRSNTNKIRITVDLSNICGTPCATVWARVRWPRPIL